MLWLWRNAIMSAGVTSQPRAPAARGQLCPSKPSGALPRTAPPTCSPFALAQRNPADRLECASNVANVGRRPVSLLRVPVRTISSGT